MMELHVLGAGAAKRLVLAVATDFSAATGIEVKGVFGAVGAIKDRFLAGETCDVLILTDGLLEDLESQGLLGRHQPLGLARTGIAVPNRQADPDISTGAGLRAALTASRAIFMSDGERSTAGRHFMSVLRDLGIADDVAPYLHAFDNGELAMNALALSQAEHALGCTQITEIKPVTGLRVVGSLPASYDLATVYAAAARAGDIDNRPATQFIELLCAPASLKLRADLGFEA